MGQTSKTLEGKVEDLSNSSKSESAKIYRYLTDPIKFNEQAIKAFGLKTDLKPEPWMHLVAIPFTRTVGSKKTYEVTIAIYIWDTRVILETYSLTITKKLFESLLTELTRENRKNTSFKFPKDNNKNLVSQNIHDTQNCAILNDFTFKLPSVRY